MPVSAKELEDLISRVQETPGWEVVSQPTRWRITNSKGGGPYFLNKRPPKGNTLQPILVELGKRGWDAQQAEMAAEEARLRRLAQDREANELKLLEAQTRMREADLSALRAEVVKRDEEILALRAIEAVSLRGGVTKEVADIDAETARVLLQHNNFFITGGPRNTEKTLNRPIDTGLVTNYRNAMLRGEWTQSHQGLAFDKDMNLIDGQHRLLAVIEADKIKSGIFFTTEITYNLDPAVFAVVDSGKKRTTSDVLALHNIPNRLVSAAATRLIHLYYTVPYSQWVKYRMTNSQTLSLYPYYDNLDGTPGQMAEAVRVSSRLIKTITTGSASAAGYYITKRAYPAEDHQEFVRGLATGEDLPSGDPRLAYRRFNDRLNKSKRRGTNNVEQLALYIKAWNAFVEGVPMHNLVWRSNEPFPHPIQQGKASDYPEVLDSDDTPEAEDAQ